MRWSHLALFSWKLQWINAIMSLKCTISCHLTKVESQEPNDFTLDGVLTLVLMETNWVVNYWFINIFWIYQMSNIVPLLSFLYFFWINTKCRLQLIARMKTNSFVNHRLLSFESTVNPLNRLKGPWLTRKKGGKTEKMYKKRGQTAKMSFIFRILCLLIDEE